jgi:hypothetical protein
MKDTSPAVERKFRGMLMQRTGAERLKMGCSMHSTAQALAKAYISEQHPDAHPRELKQRLFLHFYGADFTPRQRKRILSALSTRGRPDAVTARQPLKSTELAAVRESRRPYGKRRPDSSEPRRS